MTNEYAISILTELKARFCRDMLYDTALDLAISALERDRWISDRPPLQDEANGYVLAMVDGKCGSITFDGALVMAEYDPEYGDWFLDEYPNAVFKVKAWRPLPEPPKEET